MNLANEQYKLRGWQMLKSNPSRRVYVFELLIGSIKCNGKQSGAAPHEINFRHYFSSININDPTANAICLTCEPLDGIQIYDLSESDLEKMKI